MKISKYHYAAQFPRLPQVVQMIGDLLVRGDYVLGQHVEEFEHAFAEYVGVEQAVGLNSGTDALVLALRALGIGPGDEVITVANTFHATALAITTVGARPVLVDCTADDYLMDLDQVATAVTSRTRAIIAVHLFGKALDMTALTAVAERHGLAVVEDCAQAVGARWQGRQVGSWGDIGCFSFHPSKNLAAAGDGGAVTTDRADLSAAIRTLRGLGQAGQNDHVVLGCNSKLDAIQALVLSHKLPELEGWNAGRRAVADRYRQALTGVAQVPASAGPEHVFHLYQIGVDRRDEVLADLVGAGIDAVVRYPVPIHRQPAFAELGLAGDFPHADRQATGTLCLPVRPDLTIAETDYITDQVIAAVTGRTGASR
ncbi:dTDP-4-amino-4,6-dideoxygalactose transaminase [Actinoplanes octamycinicus]|uniref:dTDP-4-amino-4,6-dideoxygalactose transaminase n=1 Tax=Actinoplanes octamycinicus TaxID=135948 RepID=A0A7W7H5E1_9ACTN|nr:DegT/DnrJ/EryC1/StrS family aminotransferase [Actinoplanes octamycinicus]MBB4743962.1 dTDP-4-amino-4,6-dideoxygalactose transaminase [Actinoplanes octamycinicus]GIE58586.1 aminotransferase DegT [Actinoplanes octamycinicus]